MLQMAGYQAILHGHAGRVPVSRPDRRLLDCLAQHRQARGIPAPAPRRLAAGAHRGLLYVGRPLAASSPATHRQHPQQAAGNGMGLTRSRWGPGHGTLRWTRASERARKALRSQGHQCAHVM